MNMTRNSSGSSVTSTSAAGHNGNEEPDDDLDERKRDARDNLVDERGRQDGDEQEQTEGQRFHNCISFWVSAMGE